MLAYWVWGGAIIALLIWGRKARVWLAISFVTWLFSIGAQIPKDLYVTLYEDVSPWVLAKTWAPTLGLDPGSIEPAGLVMPHYMAAYIHLPYFDRLWFSYRILVVTFLEACHWESAFWWIALQNGGDRHRYCSVWHWWLAPCWSRGAIWHIR